MGRHNTVEDFHKKYLKLESGCWEWQGCKSKEGYGKFMFQRKKYMAHRLSWIFFNGEFSEVLHVLHHCDNPPCVNPNHLFLGTNQDNVDDKMRKNRHPHKLRTHCKNGHPFTEDNIRERKDCDGRICLICSRERVRKYSATEKGKLKHHEDYLAYRAKHLERIREYDRIRAQKKRDALKERRLEEW